MSPVTRWVRVSVPAILIVCLLAAGCGGSSSPSAQRLAGEYVKAEAANSGVTIIGDKVWSVRHDGDTTIVVVRIKFRVPTRCDLFGCMPPSIQWVTVFVREFDGQLLP